MRGRSVIAAAPIPHPPPKHTHTKHEDDGGGGGRTLLPKQSKVGHRVQPPLNKTKKQKKSTHGTKKKKCFESNPDLGSPRRPSPVVSQRLRFECSPISPLRLFVGFSFVLRSGSHGWAACERCYEDAADRCLAGGALPLNRTVFLNIFAVCFASAPSTVCCEPRAAVSTRVVLSWCVCV